MNTALTHADLVRTGRAIRKRISRRAHGEFSAPDRDPVAILKEQNRGRLAELVPVRFGRMLQSPFSYYRGTAAVMAHDLAQGQVSGLQVVSCGDAHISNFGLYASPERNLLFDLNDFDEAGLAPWEWDVKRLVASVVIGGRDRGFSEEQTSSAATEALAAYRRGVRRASGLTVLERYYFHVDADDIVDALTVDEDRDLIDRTVKKARVRTSDQVLDRMVTISPTGSPKIVDEPPVTRHVEHGGEIELAALFDQYRETLRADTAQVLSQFRMVDYVLRVVGVGSVGTRCYVILFVGPSGEPLFLQAKEAGTSVLESHGGISRILPDGVPPASRGHHGHRVIACQRILQAQSDPFLGWIQGYRGDDADRPATDYYWRQFRDMKGSVDLAKVSTGQFGRYASLCAALLARAHSQSPLCVAIAAYLGEGGKFDEAVVRWAHRYADQTERDFARLEQAAKSGEIPVEYDV